MGIPKIHSSFFDVSGPYPLILLDAWGVFWGGGGVGLLPGSKDMMSKLVAQGKIIGIVSNSTQLAQKEIEKLLKVGLEMNVHYHFLITSGELTKKVIHQDDFSFETPLKKYWLLGDAQSKQSSHRAIFADSVYTQAETLEEADFIYVAIPQIKGEDQLDPEIFKEKVLNLVPFKKPMVCPNPDRFAHEGSPPRPVVRQGSIAEIYEKAGGEVIYIGKPSLLMYQTAFNQARELRDFSLEECIMIGDTPETDIRGGNRMGMVTALVTQTGMVAERLAHKSIKEFVDELPLDDFPNYFVTRFGV